MKKIFIKSALIVSFRNLSKIAIEANNENHICIYGNNMQGKTNVLNAIYWCLTGHNLTGDDNDFSNVPYGKRDFKVDGTICDVKLTLSIDGVEHTIHRTIENKGNKLSQVLVIDCEEFALKNGELKIDELLGTLALTVKDTKAFSIRRFLLNPMYYLNVAPKDLRAYMVKLLCGDANESEILAKSGLSEKTKKLIASGIAAHKTVANFSKATNDAIKKITKEQDALINVKSFIAEQKSNVFDDVIAKKDKDISSRFMAESEKKVTIDEFSKYLNDYYLATAKSKNLGIVFLEKGQGEDSWDEVCYPKLLTDDLSIKLGSTAERILVSCLFVATIRKFCNLGSLPILVDEGETIDYSSLQFLSDNCGCQIIMTDVVREKMEHIEVK